MGTKSEHEQDNDDDGNDNNNNKSGEESDDKLEDNDNNSKDELVGTLQPTIEELHEWMEVLEMMLIEEHQNQGMIEDKCKDTVSELQKTLHQTEWA